MCFACSIVFDSSGSIFIVFSGRVGFASSSTFHDSGTSKNEKEKRPGRCDVPLSSLRITEKRDAGSPDAAAGKHGNVSAPSTTKNDNIHNNNDSKKNEQDRKSTRLNSSHSQQSRMPSSA